MTLIATNASGLRLPLLGRGDAPLHLVPIDYVIDAAWQVARDERSAGQTFHIVDPAPLTAREVFEGVAQHANTSPPRGSIPRPLARAVLRTPGLARLGRGPHAFLDMIDHTVHYDQQNTANALAGTTLRCPPLADYLPVLVRPRARGHPRRRSARGRRARRSTRLDHFGFVEVVVAVRRGCEVDMAAVRADPRIALEVRRSRDRRCRAAREN